WGGVDSPPARRSSSSSTPTQPSPIKGGVITLTKQPTAPRATGDRPALEIEITQEMIAAGEKALLSFLDGDGVYLSLSAETVEAVLRAALQAHRKMSCRSA